MYLFIIIIIIIYFFFLGGGGGEGCHSLSHPWSCCLRLTTCVLIVCELELWVIRNSSSMGIGAVTCVPGSSLPGEGKVQANCCPKNSKASAMKHKENHYTWFLWPSNLLTHYEKQKRTISDAFFSEKNCNYFCISPLCMLCQTNVAAARKIRNWRGISSAPRPRTPMYSESEFDLLAMQNILMCWNRNIWP